MMEANPGEAVKNNVFGTRTLVDEAVRAGRRGVRDDLHRQGREPDERHGGHQARWPRCTSRRSRPGPPTRLVTVRFGNVLGSNGSVVPIFKEQIRRGGPVTVTHPEMTRYFMTIPEASQLVLQAGALGRGGEIFVLDMGEPVRIVDLARDLIRLSGLRRGPRDRDRLHRPAPRREALRGAVRPDEDRLPTPHPKIFRARHRPSPADDLHKSFERLAYLVDGPAPAVIAMLREIVPEYRHAPAKKVPRPLELASSHATD